MKDIFQEGQHVDMSGGKLFDIELRGCGMRPEDCGNSSREELTDGYFCSMRAYPAVVEADTGETTHVLGAVFQVSCGTERPKMEDWYWRGINPTS